MAFTRNLKDMILFGSDDKCQQAITFIEQSPHILEKFKYPLLFEAIENSSFSASLLVRLIKLYHSINMPINALITEDKKTALHVVAKERREDLLDVILKEFDDVVVYDKINQLPLHYFASSQKEFTEEKVTQLYQAEFFKKLGFERAELINAKDSESQTPLHLAAHWGEPEAVFILLQHQANPHIRDNNNLLPADVINERFSSLVKENLFSKVNLLLSAENPDTLHRYQYSESSLTPLYLAIRAGAAQAVNVQLSKGADIHSIQTIYPHQHALIFCLTANADEYGGEWLKQYRDESDIVSIARDIIKHDKNFSASSDIGCNAIKLANKLGLTEVCKAISESNKKSHASHKKMEKSMSFPNQSTFFAKYISFEKRHPPMTQSQVDKNLKRRTW